MHRPRKVLKSGGQDMASAEREPIMGSETRKTAAIKQPKQFWLFYRSVLWCCNIGLTGDLFALFVQQ